MTVVAAGRIQDNAIVFTKPLPFAEGAEVEVEIAPVVAGETSDTTASEAGDDDLSFYGMWKDREDMADSVAWVRKVRESWQQRLLRQD